MAKTRKTETETTAESSQTSRQLTKGERSRKLRLEKHKVNTAILINFPGQK